MAPLRKLSWHRKLHKVMRKFHSPQMPPGDNGDEGDRPGPLSKRAEIGPYTHSVRSAS